MPPGEGDSSGRWSDEEGTSSPDEISSRPSGYARGSDSSSKNNGCGGDDSASGPGASGLGNGAESATRDLPNVCGCGSAPWNDADCPAGSS